MKKHNFCIIDDDLIHLEVVKKILTSTDFCKSIITYSDGKDAFEGLKNVFELNENLPDIILLDINMPVWDGWDFLEEFIKLNVQKKIFIFIVSSSIFPEDIKKAKSYAIVQDFFTKPIALTKLINAIQQ